MRVPVDDCRWVEVSHRELKCVNAAILLALAPAVILREQKRPYEPNSWASVLNFPRTYSCHTSCS
jgi:hypothetical protein